MSKSKEVFMQMRVEESDSTAPHYAQGYYKMKAQNNQLNKKINRLEHEVADAYAAIVRLEEKVNKLIENGRV
jgi:hypothetical protein